MAQEMGEILARVNVMAGGKFTGWVDERDPVGLRSGPSFTAWSPTTGRMPGKLANPIKIDRHRRPEGYVSGRTVLSSNESIGNN